MSGTRKANRKDWLAFVCTAPELSEEEIIRIYGKSWQIEVFFKTYKSVLNLTGECHCLSYDALTAYTASCLPEYLQNFFNILSFSPSGVKQPRPFLSL